VGFSETVFQTEGIIEGPKVEESVAVNDMEVRGGRS
jgi:hypothetical protein